MTAPRQHGLHLSPSLLMYPAQVRSVIGQTHGCAHAFTAKATGEESHWLGFNTGVQRVREGTVKKLLTRPLHFEGAGFYCDEERENIQGHLDIGCGRE